MGILVKGICCVNTNILDCDKENSNSFEHVNEKGNLLNRKFSEELSEPPKQNLPLNEIKSDTDSNNRKTLPSIDPKEIESLSRIPISTRTVIRKQLGNPLDDYNIINMIDKGTFGTVYKVMQKNTGKVRAMKVIPKNNLRVGFTDEDIIQEINILKKLEHPHIIKLYEFYIYKDNYYLINEFCTEGDLSEQLTKLKKFPEFFVKILMVQVFNAVLYLHDNCVIHGDLKLENIMIDSFLNKDDISNLKPNKYNFIQSLLDDEKEINEYLRQNELKRASTYHDFGVLEKHDLKSKMDYQHKYFNRENNNNSTFNSLLKVFKRGNTKNSVNIFNRNNLQEEKKNMKINNTEKEEKEEKEKKPKIKSAFSFLNGEVDSEEEKEESKNNEDKLNIIEDKNGEEGIGQIKLNSENIMDSQMSGNINNMNQNPNVHQRNICNQLQKSLTLKTMKMKNFELKLIDFGCSKIFSKNKLNFKDTIGTLIYCSPEVLRNDYNKQCDIWSCGVIMYVLLSGHFPFYGKTEDEIEKKILSGKFVFNEKYFSHISEKAKDLIRKCLVYDANKRIKADEALKHEFFSDDINTHNLFEDDIDSKNVLKSLKSYSKQSKLYQTVLAYLSHNFADKGELNKLKKIFYKIDLNLDGKLSKEELFIAFKEAGMEMESEQLNKVIESIDFDGNGFIEYEEFIRVALPKEHLFTEKNLKNAFDMFDLDKNGSISMDEFKEIMGIKQLNDKLNKELMKEIPIQGDEEMNFEQFKSIILNSLN